jgi:hypothetical protein
MKTTATLQMPSKSTIGWEDLHRRQPSIPGLVTLIVLPMSLIPPAMLYYAGIHYGNEFVAGFGDKQWEYVAVIFFLAELLTFAVMGWLIYELANTPEAPGMTRYGVDDHLEIITESTNTREPRISVHDAYLLAAIAPIPLWLSGFALFIPNLLANIVIALAALAVSCSLVYTGLKGLCRVEEPLIAASCTYTVMAACVMAWGLLLALVWAF